LFVFLSSRQIVQIVQVAVIGAINREFCLQGVYTVVRKTFPRLKAALGRGRTQMNTFLRISICAVLLTGGCSTSSGVLRSGPDTYTVNVLANIYPGGVAAAKRAAYEEGYQECAQSGKEFLALNEQITPSAVDLTFKCLPKGDPELIRRSGP